MPKPREGLSERAFAKIAGISRGRVNQLKAEGLPVLPDGSIDPKAGQRWIADRLDPKRRAAARKANGTGKRKLDAVADLRADKLRQEGELLDLELRKRRGELIDRGEAERVIFGRARMERDAWTGWAARVAPEIAAATGANHAAMFATLDRLVREHLAELAKTPLEVADG